MGWAPAEIARDLAPVAEVLVEHLLGQRRRERRTETFEPLQQLTAPNHLSRRRCRIDRGRHPLERIELLAHQHQPRMLVLDLDQDPGRHPWPCQSRCVASQLNQSRRRGLPTAKPCSRSRALIRLV